MNSEINLIAKSLVRSKHAAVIGGKPGDGDDFGVVVTVDNDFHVSFVAVVDLFTIVASAIFGWTQLCQASEKIRDHMTVLAVKTNLNPQLQHQSVESDNGPIPIIRF